MTPQDVVEWAREHLENEPNGAVRMTGGLMNEVWRIEGAPMAVLKRYTDRSVENPNVELTMERARFESAALQLFEHDDDLREVRRHRVAVPRLLHFDPAAGFLAMTHLDHEFDIGAGLRQGKVGEDTVARLGRWLGALHRLTMHRVDLLRRFKNTAVQRTRLRVQYASVETALQDASVDVAPERLREAGRRALALGRTLLEPGDCLVMGDLWPRSVLVSDDRLGVIDWEFCHYGRPLQDVGHFAAHLWMIADNCSDRIGRIRLHQARGAFLESYFRAAHVWGEHEREAASVHAGCEIVMRTHGAFADQSMFPDPAHRAAAAARGIDAMLGNWSPLDP